ncbi:MAG: SDR family NAD(P)-dependent oxidoreductase [Pseudomonadota bacterium]
MIAKEGIKALKKMNIVLTGASAGIGAALARDYAIEGHFLFLTGRNEERLNTVASECEALGATIETTILDVVDTHAVHQWINRIEEQTPIDLVIANAGIMETCEPDGQIETAENSILQVNTNLNGCINLATAAAPFMQSRGGGQIAFIASLAGIQPIADVPGYSASKAGLIAYGEALGNYLHNQGVKVSVICPSFITTAMTSRHKSFRPFEMSAEKASRKIKRVIAAGSRLAAFPLVMEIAIRLGRFLPAKLRRPATKPFNFTK